ncbi:MAG: hypothetical protein J5483_05175 [Lachnospiraceae bacterium]|nr:hypothetical protein [Lachnospiraceae bacterium]
MKKTALKTILPVFLTIMFVLCLLIRFPVKTYAAGVSIYPGADIITVGDSVTVTVTLYGDEIYAYSGYIDCDGIFSGYTGGFADGADGSGAVSISYTFQAVGEGTGSIYVGGCEVSDGETKQSAGGDSCTITVLGNDNGSGGTGGGAGGWDYNDNYSYDWGSINGYEVGEGSGNTNLGSLEVVGYTLKDEGNGIFSVVVSGSVDKITIKATAEDPAATVDGAGEKTLAVGDNYFDIVVYAENGLAQGYALKVTRRSDKIALTDLLTELKETRADQVTVSLKDGDKLTKEMIDAVAKWGKTLNLNRYDADGKLLYGWTLNGKEMADAKEFKEFDPTVTFESKAADKINALSNFASGKILSFAFSGDLPKGTKFAFAAGKDFRKDDIVRLYYFDEKENQLTQVGEEVKVEDEVITVELEHCSEYFVTRALIAPKEEVKAEKDNKGLINYIVMGVELAVIIALALFIILRMRRSNAPLKEKRKPENPVKDIFDSAEDYEMTEIRH